MEEPAPRNLSEHELFELGMTIAGVWPPENWPRPSDAEMRKIIKKRLVQLGGRDLQVLLWVSTWLFIEMNEEDREK